MTAGVIVADRPGGVRASSSRRRGVRIVPQARAGVVERLGRYSARSTPGLTLDRPVRRPRQAADRPARAGRLVPAAAGDHRGQPRRRHRHRHLLHGHRPEGRDLRGRQPAAGDRAAHGHHAAQRDRRHDARGDADLAATTSTRSCASCSTRRPASWGIRVNRVELKSVEPPRTVQEAMEKQMRAERDRRAAILTAEGVKQSQILTAEGEKQAAVLKAEGAKTAAILRAEGEAKAIETVFQAIHDGAARPGAALLPVPADAAAARPGRGQQDLRHPERVHPGARQHRQRAGAAGDDGSRRASRAEAGARGRRGGRRRAAEAAAAREAEAASARRGRASGERAAGVRRRRAGQPRPPSGA